MPTRPRASTRWHRTAGLCVALVLVYLVVTGTGLQYTAALGLGHRYVQSPALLDRYNLQPPTSARRAGPFIEYDGMLYHHNQLFDAAVTPLQSAADGVDALFALTRDQLILFAKANAGEPAELIERIDLPAPARRLGRNNDNDWIIATISGQHYSGGLDLLTWTPVPEPVVRWYPDAIEITVPEPIARQGTRQLSWERVLQDLHSGRFFGAAGVWVMNAVNALLVLLAVTGLMLWLRRH